jgi:hypothetical protein
LQRWGGEREKAVEWGGYLGTTETVTAVTAAEEEERGRQVEGGRWSGGWGALKRLKRRGEGESL